METQTETERPKVLPPDLSSGFEAGLMCLVSRGGDLDRDRTLEANT